DYMLVIFHTGNYDSPVSKFGSNKSPNNFYAINNRKNSKGFVFFAHDNEHTLLIDNINVGSGIEENRVNIGSINGNNRMEVGDFGKFHPQWLHHKLTENAEYRLRFADHVYRHYFNNGIFQPQRVSALFMKRADMISLAIIAESARWGSLYLSKNRSWLPTVTEIAQVYLYDRYDIVLDQYMNAGLYPKIDPPIFKADGQELLDESLSIAPSFTLELLNSNNGEGSIYYTLNGSDPRAVGGSLSSSAIDAGDQKLMIISSTSIVNARVKSGNVWSALHSLRLTTSSGLPTLKITEIHYKPLENQSVSGSEYEFLEFKNIGNSPLDLSLATFNNGVQYTFPIGASVDNGRFVVLASNAAAFKERYGFSPTGEFAGQLDNAGERIVLLSAAGDTVVNVRYNDKAPWPEEPDQSGHSLAAVVMNPVGDANDPLYWVSSYTVHGSPGHDDKIAAAVDRTHSPGSFSLAQNFPNPFNSGTRIEFYLPVQCHVTITLFDILGREIERIIDDEFESGRHDRYWDGAHYPAGVYIYRLETSNGFRQSKKMLLIK
ncbi:MAG: T9SS C-terminal target domain-containing protein, partial [Calditrichaeota bacterium]